MPNQFVVPQFIEVEDRILGPLSVRQFLILLIGGLLEVALWKILNLIPFILVGIPLLLLTGVFAFAKINGMPFHFFLINLIQTLRRPRQRVWDKTLTTAEVKNFLGAPPPPPPPLPPRKALPSATRLQELALIVNTGGAYKPEE